MLYRSSISGSVKIIQAIAPLNGQLFIQNLKDQIYATGFGGVEQIFALEGEYTTGESYPLIPFKAFKAFMNLKRNWNLYVQNSNYKKCTCTYRYKQIISLQ